MSGSIATNRLREQVPAFGAGIVVGCWRVLEREIKFENYRMVIFWVVLLHMTVFTVSDGRNVVLVRVFLYF